MIPGEYKYLPTFSGIYHGGIYQVIRIPMDGSMSSIKIYLQSNTKLTQFVGTAGFPSNDWYFNVDCYSEQKTTTAPYQFEAVCETPQNSGDYYIGIRDLTQTPYTADISVTPQYCSSPKIRGSNCDLCKFW